MLSNLPYGPKWRSGRQLFSRHLHPTNLRIFEPGQLSFVRGHLLPQFLEISEQNEGDAEEGTLIGGDAIRVIKQCVLLLMISEQCTQQV